MNISKEEIKKEKKYLDNCINVIKDYLSELGQELYEKEEKSQEFKKYIWDNKASLDPTELKSLMSDNDLEVYLMMQKGKYFQRLFKIQNSPYFGSIIFEEENEPSKNIYLGITHLEDKNKNYLIYDWRAPISSLFYDYEVGECSYKAPEKIIKDIEDYVLYLIKNIKFTKNIEIDIFNEVTKEQLKELFERYDRFPLFTRITEISKKLSENYARGKLTLARSINKKILESMNIEKNYKKIYYNFYKSKFCKIKLSDNEIRKFVNKNKINYEDAIIFSYIKGLLEGFNYNNMIKEIVVDEAQDYTLLQYKILSKIFKKSSFSILGDVNQTINPYYKYESLEQIKEVLDKTKYLELTKTYRSSKEIIEYTNKILNLTFVSAIRKDNNKPVLFRKETNLKKQLLNDINYLKKEYKSVAIITKEDEEANEIYNLLKDNINIGKITINEEIFRKDLIVVPSYMAKGLEFDSVIVYNKINNIYKENEKYLYYVACTRAQHELIIYN